MTARRAAWSAVVVIVAGGCGVLAYEASPVEPRWVAAVACAAVIVAVGWSLWLRRELVAARAAYGRERRTARARGDAVSALAAELPVVVEQGGTAPDLDRLAARLAQPAAGESFAGDLDTLVAWLAEKGPARAVRQERAMSDSVMAAFESVARTVHQMATVQQEVLDRIEQSLSDPALMGQVMQADHAAAQMTRKAQVLLVMCGVWPAVRESRPVSLYDCVRGAKSRILEFQRVTVHGGESVHVSPTVVEGLMHSIAELLENATVFSPSSADVVVTVREVAAGAVVEIDDAGLGMPSDVLDKAAAQLRDDLDLTQLGAVPRLGLACVGRWMRELGFRVELSSASAYGGTRAVVFVPLALLKEPVAPAPAARPLVEDGGARDTAERPAQTPGGLPLRRNRRRASAAPARQEIPAGAPSSPPPSGEAEHGSPTPSWSPKAAGASIASVVAGTRRGRGRDERDDVHSDDAPTHTDGGRS
ncbi:ATP-binding protein [Streptomyces sp. DW26H14]|uniref:ATP-binding protein n=1 Tax=Streptomyces sp. DW26H14 TaxID=3435395 RepID=UPI00403DABF9